MALMPNMPEIQAEVLYAMEPEKAPPVPEAGEETPVVSFGAKDVQDLSWKNLLDAYTCTECGRCSAVCPATNHRQEIESAQDYDGYPRPA